MAFFWCRWLALREPNLRALLKCDSYNYEKQCGSLTAYDNEIVIHEGGPKSLISVPLPAQHRSWILVRKVEMKESCAATPKAVMNLTTDISIRVW